MSKCARQCNKTIMLPSSATPAPELQETVKKVLATENEILSAKLVQAIVALEKATVAMSAKQTELQALRAHVQELEKAIVDKTMSDACKDYKIELDRPLVKSSSDGLWYWHDKEQSEEDNKSSRVKLND